MTEELFMASGPTDLSRREWFTLDVSMSTEYGGYLGHVRELGIVTEPASDPLAALILAAESLHRMLDMGRDFNMEIVHADEPKAPPLLISSVSVPADAPVQRRLTLEEYIAESERWWGKNATPGMERLVDDMVAAEEEDRPMSDEGFEAGVDAVMDFGYGELERRQQKDD